MKRAEHFRQKTSISTLTALAHSLSLFSQRKEEERVGKKKALAARMSSSGFQRPGTRSSGRTFGISLSVDRAVSASGQAAAMFDASKLPSSSANHQPSTAAVSSAVAAAKNQILFLVERHAVVVVQGEPNGGKADKVRACRLFFFRCRGSRAFGDARNANLSFSLFLLYLDTKKTRSRSSSSRRDGQEQQQQEQQQEQEASRSRSSWRCPPLLPRSRPPPEPLPRSAAAERWQRRRRAPLRPLAVLLLPLLLLLLPPCSSRRPRSSATPSPSRRSPPRASPG